MESHTLMGMWKWLVPGVVFAGATMLLWRRLRTLNTGLIGVFFSLTWLTVSAAYIDSHPGIYAEELYRDIGGGWSAVRLASFYGVFVLGVLLVFRRSRSRRLARWMNCIRPVNVFIGGFSLYTIANVLVGMFLLALYVQLLRGPIPLFTGMDRYTYKVRHSYLLMELLYKYKDFIGLFLGVLFFYEVRGDKPRARNVTAVLFLLILLYFVLIGNRFSTPFFCLCMFLLPLGLLGLRPPRGSIPALGRRARWRFRGALGGIVLVAVTLLAFGVGRYYSSFQRGTVIRRLAQRVGVKQGQMWWATVDCIYRQGDWRPREAFQAVFVDPLVGEGGHTALRYLMARHVGQHRVASLLRQGYLYTGAFPAILLALCGPVWSYLAMLVIAMVLADLLYWMYRAIAKHHYLTVFFLAFVLQPFLFLVIGGDLYKFTKWGFGVKLGLMFLAMAYDNRREMAGFWAAMTKSNATGIRSPGRSDVYGSKAIR